MVGENGLAILYPLIIGLSFVCSVTSAVAWAHWKYVLDTCGEYKKYCGCFLYGQSSLADYSGGHSAYCHFAVYGLALPVLIAIIFGCFHVYRVCMGTGKRKKGSISVRQRSGDIMVVTAESEVTDDGISPYYWIPTSIFSVLMAVYTLVYAAIYTDGLFKSCNEYRTELIKEIPSTGNMVAVLRGRLSCSAVFDFMDYIHRDVIDFYRRRHDRINSAACFYMTLICSWAALVSWIAVSFINIRSAQRSRSVRM